MLRYVRSHVLYDSGAINVTTKSDKELDYQLEAVSVSRPVELECQLNGQAFMKNGRLCIPCGNGNVTLPAMSGIGDHI